jgi:CRP-like cAMP-binding protein
VAFPEIEAGSFFGELSALEGVPGSLSAFALDDSILAKMPGSVFVATLFNHRPLGEAVVAALVVRNRAMTRKVAEAAQICENPLPLGGRTSRRPEPICLDAGVDIRPVKARQRRARRWS